MPVVIHHIVSHTTTPDDAASPTNHPRNERGDSSHRRFSECPLHPCLVNCTVCVDSRRGVRTAGTYPAPVLNYLDLRKHFEKVRFAVPVPQTSSHKTNTYK